jgi:hypothetical protein
VRGRSPATAHVGAVIAWVSRALRLGSTRLCATAAAARRVGSGVFRRRWHDDAADYEHDTEKWSVPGRLGYRIVFATWDKVTECPAQLLAELTATLAA